MQLSRIVNLAMVICLGFLASCASTHYRVMRQDVGRAELSVSPDRILLQCEYLADADQSGMYGFMIHILDDHDTVLTAIQGNTLDRFGCSQRLERIGQILKRGERIYLGGMADLTEPRVTSQSTYRFPKHGVFRENGRSMQFVVIANEYGDCFDAYRGTEKPCPSGDFPIVESR